MNIFALFITVISILPNIMISIDTHGSPFSKPKNIDDYVSFDLINNIPDFIKTESHYGPPGTPGKPGKDGKPGLPGPPGKCDCINSNASPLSGDVYNSPKYKKGTGIHSKVKHDGYNDKIAYAGDDIYVDESLSDKGYVNGGNHLNEYDKSYGNNHEYGGDSVYEHDNIALNGKTAYQIDHTMHYKKNFNDENHYGAYSGDEYNVKHRESDIHGGYNNNDYDRGTHVEGYGGNHVDDTYAKGGKSYGNEYGTHGGSDKHGYYNDRHYGDGYGNSYHDDKKLYGNYKGHGSEYGKDEYYKDKQIKDHYGGGIEKDYEKSGYDKGKFRETDVTGKENHVSYGGDYVTNNKNHDVDLKVGHYENIHEDIHHDIGSDKHYESYKGGDSEYKRDGYKDYGGYHDDGYNKKYDGVKHGKKYDGGGYSGGHGYDERRRYSNSYSSDDSRLGYAHYGRRKLINIGNEMKLMKMEIDAMKYYVVGSWVFGTVFGLFVFWMVQKLNRMFEK